MLLVTLFSAEVALRPIREDGRAVRMARADREQRTIADEARECDMTAVALVRAERAVVTVGADVLASSNTEDGLLAELALGRVVAAVALAFAVLALFTIRVG
jgi:hypothetical protein